MSWGGRSNTCVSPSKTAGTSISRRDSPCCRSNLARQAMSWTDFSHEVRTIEFQVQCVPLCAAVYTAARAVSWPCDVVCEITNAWILFLVIALKGVEVINREYRVVKFR